MLRGRVHGLPQGPTGLAPETINSFPPDAGGRKSESMVSAGPRSPDSGGHLPCLSRLPAVCLRGHMPPPLCVCPHGPLGRAPAIGSGPQRELILMTTPKDQIRSRRQVLGADVDVSSWRAQLHLLSPSRLLERKMRGGRDLTSAYLPSAHLKCCPHPLPQYQSHPDPGRSRELGTCHWSLKTS